MIEVIEAHRVPCDCQRLLRQKLYKIKGIRHSRSSFVLRTLKKVDLPLFVY